MLLWTCSRAVYSAQQFQPGHVPKNMPWTCPKGYLARGPYWLWSLGSSSGGQPGGDPVVPVCLMCGTGVGLGKTICTFVEYFLLIPELSQVTRSLMKSHITLHKEHSHLPSLLAPWNLGLRVIIQMSIVAGLLSVWNHCWSALTLHNNDKLCLIPLLYSILCIQNLVLLSRDWFQIVGRFGLASFNPD